MKKVKKETVDFTEMENESAEELLYELYESQTPYLELPEEKTQPNQPPEAPNFSSLIIEFLPKIKKQVSYCFHMLDSQEDRDYFKKEKGLTTSRLTKLYLAKNLIDVLTLSEFLKLAEMVKDTENQLLINFPD